MGRINLKHLETLEAVEDRQRKSTSAARAIRKQRRRNRVCRQCGGDCQSLMAGMQVFLNAARAEKAGRA